MSLTHAFFGNQHDFPFLPPGTRGDIQVFNVTYASGQSNAQTWTKPRGVVMVHILMISGGGGAGGGHSAATTVARGGGAGGGCSAGVQLLIPAYYLPDILKALVGRGGAGGTATNDGTAGTASAICLAGGLNAPNSGQNQIISCNAGAGGAKGTTLVGGAQTTAAGTPSNAQFISAWILNTRSPGLIGAAGGAQTGAIGASISSIFQAGVPLTGGAGGAGVNAVNTGFAGGSVSCASVISFGDLDVPTTLASAGAAGGVAAGGDGGLGFNASRYLLFSGGGGGGSSDKAIGGNGGDGGIGCGGGGGGGGTTGGTGGRGGDGVIIITSL